jgi:hypothetical protein
MNYTHKAVPRFQCATDSLTVGPQQSAIYENLELHPTKTMQDNLIVNAERQNLQQMSVLYGSHLPMRFVIERNMLAQTRRLGGYGSSLFGLNMHMDRYDDIDFLDILNDPNESPEMERVSIHAQMEKLYGM